MRKKERHCICKTVCVIIGQHSMIKVRRLTWWGTGINMYCFIGSCSETAANNEDVENWGQEVHYLATLMMFLLIDIRCQAQRRPRRRRVGLCCIQKVYHPHNTHTSLFIGHAAAPPLSFVTHAYPNAHVQLKLLNGSITWSQFININKSNN